MSLRGPARALPSVTMALLYYPLLAVMVGLLYLWGIRGLYSRFGLCRRSGGKAGAVPSHEEAVRIARGHLRLHRP